MNKTLLVYERLRVSADGISSEYMDFLRSHNPDITFAVLLSHDPYLSEYRALYFDLGLDADVAVQTLLDMSLRDVELCAMVLTHASQSFDVFDSSL